MASVCGRRPLGKRFYLVICRLAVSGHLFGLLERLVDAAGHHAFRKMRFLTKGRT